VTSVLWSNRSGRSWVRAVPPIVCCCLSASHSSLTPPGWEGPGALAVGLQQPAAKPRPLRTISPVHKHQGQIRHDENKCMETRQPGTRRTCGSAAHRRVRWVGWASRLELLPHPGRPSGRRSPAPSSRRAGLRRTRMWAGMASAASMAPALRSPTLRWYGRLHLSCEEGVYCASACFFPKNESSSCRVSACFSGHLFFCLVIPASVDASPRPSATPAKASGWH